MTFRRQSESLIFIADLVKACDLESYAEVPLAGKMWVHGFRRPSDAKVQSD